MKLVSLLKDLAAPTASSKISFVLNRDVEEFLSSLGKDSRVSASDHSDTVFRVAGEPVADLRAINTVFGRKAKPKHYSKLGFSLKVISQEKNSVLLVAHERVLFGFLETKAIGSAQAEILEKLVLKHNRKAA
jgi:hypothetical protein